MTRERIISSPHTKTHTLINTHSYTLPLHKYVHKYPKKSVLQKMIYSIFCTGMPFARKWPAYSRKWRHAVTRFFSCTLYTKKNFYDRLITLCFGRNHWNYNAYYHYCKSCNYQLCIIIIYYPIYCLSRKIIIILIAFFYKESDVFFFKKTNIQNCIKGSQ